MWLIEPNPRIQHNDNNTYGKIYQNTQRTAFRRLRERQQDRRLDRNKLVFRRQTS